MQKKLGDSKRGTLKASEWNALFNIYIPLSILDFAYSILHDPHFDFDIFLINLCALVQCTNLVSGKVINKEDSVKFSQTYETYQNTSFNLLENIKLQQNHHYEMHLPDHIDWWRPLMGVLEFGGERLVLILQNLKTNHLIGDVEETLMKKFSQRQRLEVQMQEISE
ncbi:hypothetical protein O181_008636 [Austropuccinia psidii MF-1]|uniref:Uncharacterized protein n=1 Tax=Austropuccinia psidii MF-1 TaxID=1389203 RepID=A0A9Q3BQ86_9BASI|nr:hypothetical protein [Austropuccinia psidii MF-1]